MSNLTLVGQSHYEDSPSVATGHDDSMFFTSGLSPANKDWFLLIGINDPGDTDTGFSTAKDYRSGSFEPVFSQTYGGSPDGSAMVQAFGPGDSNFNAFRTEFGTLENPIISGDELVIHYVPPGFGGSNIGPRIYCGFRIRDTLRNYQISTATDWYPNSPAGFSDAWCFDGYNDYFPTEGGTGTSVSMTLLGGDRYMTRAAADPQGQKGMLLAYVAWDASSSPTFTPDSGWTQEAYYDPADTFGLAVYTQLFGPDDSNHTISGTLSSSAHWQAHIAAYQIHSVLPTPGVYLNRIKFRSFQE